MGMERDMGVGGEGELKSVKKRQCWTSCPMDTLKGFLLGCCALQAGLPKQPCSPDWSRHPKTRGGRTEDLTLRSIAWNKTLTCCTRGLAGPAQWQPSPRARLQAMVPDSSSGKQLAQHGGVRRGHYSNQDC